jgi:hypothetical protein
MTPAAVELALEIRQEIEARHHEADQLRSRAIERAHAEAEMAQRLVADTLESDWNSKLRALGDAREERDRSRHADGLTMDDATRDRLIAMTTDFKKLWTDAATSNRERKRLLAHIVEDVTLVKMSAQGVTNAHIRFKGGKTETVTAQNPRSHAQQMQTPLQIVELVDQLLDEHIYADIAKELNRRGLRPGGAARAGHADAPFTAIRVAYIAHAYKLRPRYQRLRDRRMLTIRELSKRLGIHEQTLVRWAKHGIIKRHAHNEHAYLYEDPGPNPPKKQCSRWNTLARRAATCKRVGSQDANPGPEEV